MFIAKLRARFAKCTDSSETIYFVEISSLRTVCCLLVVVCEGVEGGEGLTLPQNLSLFLRLSSHVANRSSLLRKCALCWSLLFIGKISLDCEGFSSWEAMDSTIGQ